MNPEGTTDGAGLKENWFYNSGSCVCGRVGVRVTSNGEVFGRAFNGGLMG